MGYICALVRRSGRAVECIGLENRRTCKGTGGSNPSSSARKMVGRLLPSGLFLCPRLRIHLILHHDEIHRMQNLAQIIFVPHQIYMLCVSVLQLYCLPPSFSP